VLFRRRRDLRHGGRLLQLRWLPGMQRPGQVLRAKQRTLHCGRGLLLGYLQWHHMRAHTRWWPVRRRARVRVVSVRGLHERRLLPYPRPALHREHPVLWRHVPDERDV
jgi:hypothetical protein